MHFRNCKNIVTNEGKPRRFYENPEERHLNKTVLIEEKSIRTLWMVVCQWKDNKRLILNSS